MEREKDARPLPSLPSTGFPTASSGSGQTGKGAGEEPEDGATGMGFIVCIIIVGKCI